MKRESPLEASRRAPEEFKPPTFPIPKNSRDLVKFATMPIDHMLYASTWAALFMVLGLMARHAVFFPRKYRKIMDNRAHWKSIATRGE